MVTLLPAFCDLLENWTGVQTLTLSSRNVYVFEKGGAVRRVSVQHKINLK